MKRASALLLLGAATLLAQANVFDTELAAGVKLFHASKFEEAIPHFARARQAEPGRWQGHAWQALSLIQLAFIDRDPQRRRDLLSEARAMTGPLVREAGVLFSDPLRHYILGLVEHGSRNDTGALDHFRRARSADRYQFAAYREIELEAQVDRAYGRGLTMIATRILMQGNFERAEALFEEAYQCLKDREGTEQNLLDIRHNLAIINEQLGRKEKAIAHLRALIEHHEDDRERRESLIASIAKIHFKYEELEKGKAVLAEVHAESRHPKVMEARCKARKLEAMREPESARMDEALAFYRSVLKTHPKDDRFLLVEDFAELVLEKVLPPEADRNRALLEEAVARLEVEVKQRPECPPFYFLLHKLHVLLGNKEKAAEYRKQHEIKKKEFGEKARYDTLGRPRCSTGT